MCDQPINVINCDLLTNQFDNLSLSLFLVLFKKILRKLYFHIFQLLKLYLLFEEFYKNIKTYQHNFRNYKFILTFLYS